MSRKEAKKIQRKSSHWIQILPSTTIEEVLINLCLTYQFRKDKPKHKKKLLKQLARIIESYNTVYSIDGIKHFVTNTSIFFIDHNLLHVIDYMLIYREPYSKRLPAKLKVHIYRFKPMSDLKNFTKCPDYYIPFVFRKGLVEPSPKGLVNDFFRFRNK